MLIELLATQAQKAVVEIVLHHINCRHEAEALKQILTELISVNILMSPIKPGNGLHLGLGAPGVVYYMKK